MIDHKKFLIGVPAFIPAIGMIVLMVITEMSVIHIALALLFLIGAALVNAIPFVFLLIMHSRRVRDKTGPINYSFNAGYIFAVLAMLAAICLLLRETALGRPGSQLAAAGFLFLPSLTVPVMLFGYISGSVLEWRIRRRCDTYVAEDAPGHKAFCVHITKHKKNYMIAIAVILAWMFLRFLPFIGIIPMPDIDSAIEIGSVRQVERMLNKGVDVNAKNKNGKTPLHMAALYGSNRIVGFLITNGAIVDIRDNDGKTPLYKAAWGGETTIAEILIKHGANVNAQDNYGDTPLHEAVRKGRSGTIKVLLDSGADVNLHNANGQTPFWDAVYWGRKGLVKLFLKHEADVNVIDNFGRTPLSVAVEEKYKGIEKLLRDHEAKK